ncbi:periplasmic heavy metal sensor [Pseudoroseicyclus tamaricis]|uniref:Periplasmic heavy metal sensor n=1 Tax=Pseudoroseicyclus tamaricis TaxID=2705421 RepID=A0A6B2JQK5_9RHOB|nr:periplasmic heavy metal sensor [Pseudoroseicyclus tamaricis]NDV00418.1 periplasmic heavy metal sensor [Pseudoroseicyclus tamaricis]
MAKTQRTRLIWRAVLVVSLAFNLLIVGLAVGMMMGGRVGPGRPPPVELSIGPVVRALSDEDRRALRSEIGEGLRRAGVLSRDADALDALVAAVGAEPFDPEAVRAVLLRQEELALRGGEVAREALVSRIAEATPADRAAFAERLAREVERRPGPPFRR